MPGSYVSVRFNPTVLGTEDSTPLGAEGYYRDADKCRFWAGHAQKIGGWIKALPTAVVGRARSAIAWAELSGALNLAVATHRRVYIFQAGSWYNITPFRSSGNLGANPISTTNGSSTVTVSHTGHGGLVGDTAVLAGLTDTGGLTINGEVIVASVPNDDSWTFEHADAATSTVAAGGGNNGTFAYEVSPARTPTPLATDGAPAHGAKGLGARRAPRRISCSTSEAGASTTGAKICC